VNATVNLHSSDVPSTFAVSFKIVMTTSVTRSFFRKQYQTCKTKTAMCKTKTDFFWSQTGLVLRPTVSDHITGEHVHNISAKATRVLNVVRRNIYHCTSEVKALAYTSLIRPHLEHASAARDTYTARDSHQLDKVQRRAARFVKRDYRHTTSVSELIPELR